MEAAEQQREGKVTELQQHQDLVAQQDSDLCLLREEHEQSVAACKQLQADIGAAAEREAALQSHAGRQQDKLANAEQRLVGKTDNTLISVCEC